MVINFDKRPTTSQAHRFVGKTLSRPSSSKSYQSSQAKSNLLDENFSGRLFSKVCHGPVRSAYTAPDIPNLPITGILGLSRSFATENQIKKPKTAPEFFKEDASEKSFSMTSPLLPRSKKGQSVRNNLDTYHIEQVNYCYRCLV